VLSKTAGDHRPAILEDGEVVLGEAVNGIALCVGDVDIDDHFAGVDPEARDGGLSVSSKAEQGECEDGEGEFDMGNKAHDLSGN
jgi:hypothetical protein